MYAIKFRDDPISYTGPKRVPLFLDHQANNIYKKGDECHRNLVHIRIGQHEQSMRQEERPIVTYLRRLNDCYQNIGKEDACSSEGCNGKFSILWSVGDHRRCKRCYTTYWSPFEVMLVALCRATVITHRYQSWSPSEPRGRSRQRPDLQRPS